MNKKLLKKIENWSSTLSDEQLEKEYYKSVYDSLGTQIDRMYELGYDSVDIIEREKYEKFLSEKSDLLQFFCEKRGIELWSYKNKKQED